jgi:hypothetical protein
MMARLAQAAVTAHTARLDVIQAAPLASAAAPAPLAPRLALLGAGPAGRVQPLSTAR